MRHVRNLLSVGIVVGTAVFIAAWLAVESRAQAPQHAALEGAWTLNQELSDQAPARGDRDQSSGQAGRHGGGYGRGGGMGRRGGFGGGMGRGGNGATADPEAMARTREAMRDLMSPPDHLTIVQTDSMVAITGPDGRTTRLSPDGKKIKDDSTKIERKTHWDGDKLVSEISGVGPGKMTQTFGVDPQEHRLRITVLMQGRDNQPRTITHVYDAEAR